MKKTYITPGCYICNSMSVVLQTASLEGMGSEGGDWGNDDTKKNSGIWETMNNEE